MINIIKTSCIVALFVSIFSGCATVGKFEKRMDGKKGLSKTQLIDEMGIPDKEYNTDSFTILEYNQSRSGTANKNSDTLVNGVMISTSTPVPYTMSCKLEFKLVNNIVESYKYQGNMCRSL